MAAIAGRTRKQLRQSIGSNLGLDRYLSSTPTAASTASSSKSALTDATLFGGDNEHNGSWLIFNLTGSANSGAIRRISDYKSTATRLIWVGDVPVTVAATDTYELWDQDFPVANVHEAINQAIQSMYGRFFDPEEDISLHGDSRVARFDIPAALDMVKAVQFRSTVPELSIHQCNTVWDETTDDEFTQTVETEFWKRGGSSLKVAVSINGGAGDIITDSFTAKDLSRYTHLEFWIYSTKALTTGEVVVHLNDSTANAIGTNKEDSLTVPTMAADTWTYVRKALNNPEIDTAITSIGFETNSDIGAVTFYLDDIKAVNENQATWNVLPSSLWHIDKEAKDLILHFPSTSPGYKLLKLIGGGNPALLTTDAAVSEAPEDYIVAWTMVQLLLAAPQSVMSNPANIAYWQSRRNTAWSKLPMLQNVRLAS
jgi:hypothetical protein